VFDGPIAPRTLPKQDARLLYQMAEWWVASNAAQAKWAKDAKECVEFLESKQWSEREEAVLKGKGRAHLIFNKISPLIRLMIGYHGNNQTDWSFQPGNDGIGTEVVADVLTKVIKQIGQSIDIEEIDSEVFQHAITTGRGWWDTRMSWEDNDFGELVSISKDPFEVYVDPDCKGYDINEGNYVQTSNFLSLDEIEYLYGKDAAKHLHGAMNASTAMGGYPTLFSDGGDEIGPATTFGAVEPNERWQDFRDTLGYQFVDRSRKSIRAVDTQYYVRKIENVFVDLETGMRAPIPKSFGEVEIAKVFEHAQKLGNPLTIAKRSIKRVQWTVIVGDLIVHNSTSPYDKFTLTGFFPYFRQGTTRGMVHDLRDPQREINKRRNAEIEAVTRNSSGGWKYTNQSFEGSQEANLKRFGSSPGFHLKWKGGDPIHEPRRIEPAQPAAAAAQLEDRARNDLRDISGFNEAALGQLDQVQSGRALEARQRQAVLAVQMYLSNYSRSKRHVGRRWLELVQRHMKNERIFRIIGENGQLSQLLINQDQVDPETGRIMRFNDVTMGKYTLIVNETPLASSFKNAKFEESLQILNQLGPFLTPDVIASISDIVVQLSSLSQPQKDQITERIQTVNGFGQQAPGAPGAAAGVPSVPGGALPAPQQQIAAPPQVPQIAPPQQQLQPIGG